MITSPSALRKPESGLRRALAVFTAVALCGCISASTPLHANEYQLTEWKRGMKVRPLFENGREMYLWFYEWNLFDAFKPGTLSQGEWHFPVRIRDRGREALIANDDIKLAARTNRLGADMVLTVTNNSEHDWGADAAIVPCWNPGPGGGSRKILRRQRTEEFINTKTYFLSAHGFERLIGRRAYFKAGTSDTSAFSERWPPGDTPAAEGLLVRESNDGRWVTGIAWDDFVFVQAHNEWDCMHVAVRVGPLRRGEAKSVRGQLYLFRGTRGELLQTHNPRTK